MSTDTDGSTVKAGRLLDRPRTGIAGSLVLCTLGIASDLLLDHEVLQNIYCNQRFQLNSEQEDA
jgi:hypothetical protein